MILYNECTVGRLVNVQERGLKVGLIVGYTRTGMIRVCKWSDNGRKWSGPQSLRDRQLYAIDETALSARHRRIVETAKASVGDSGRVLYAKGAHNIGGPAFLGVSRVFSRAKGPAVTKLAPAYLTYDEIRAKVHDYSREKLQELNPQLAAVLFRKDKP